MGRPKEFNSETVLAAATDCFWADGIGRTSISSLVDAMKIQRSSFYNSFSSRDGILMTVLERYLEASPLANLIDGSTQQDESDPDLVLIDLILDFSHFLCAEGQGRGCLLFNGLGELKPEDGQAYEIFQDYYVRLTAGLSGTLDRVQQANKSRDVVGPVSLHHVLCILMGMAHYSKLDQTEYRLATIGLEQLAGLSPHFASLIKSQPRSMETFRQSQEAERLQA